MKPRKDRPIEFTDADFKFVAWLFGQAFADRLEAKQVAGLAAEGRAAMLRKADSRRRARARARETAGTRSGPWKPPR